MEKTGNREHHYCMTRIILPKVIFSDAVENFVAAIHRDGRDVISNIWDSFADKLPENEIISSEEIDVFVDDLEKGVVLTTIKLPTPIQRNETYYIGLVKPKGSEIYRCFSLEYSVNPMNGEVGTMLTERSQDSRANHGPGPAPNKELFVKAVSNLVVSRKSPVSFIKDLFKT
ncbi:hypothetical protein [Microbulbifer sp. TRSA007]|uniref:hypothetical protein n=1 Tax=Microbulbifer sp. TRSA007 TaxID=3243384 RepID=UPI00403A16E4